MPSSFYRGGTDPEPTRRRFRPPLTCRVLAGPAECGKRHVAANATLGSVDWGGVCRIRLGPAWPKPANARCEVPVQRVKPAKYGWSVRVTAGVLHSGPVIRERPKAWAAIRPTLRR